jgi:plasminogen activator inhibitor 1 RNA-binding protein
MAEAGVSTHNPFEALSKKKDSKGSKSGDQSAEDGNKKKADAPAENQQSKAAKAPTGSKRGGQTKGRRGPAGAVSSRGGAAASGTDSRGKRVFERKSGTGDPIKGTVKKSGHGKGNWGTAEDELEAAEQVEETETGADGAAAEEQAPAAESKPAEVKPEEPEEKVRTLDEWRNDIARKAPENDKLKPREVKEDDKKWGVTGEFKKTEPDTLQIGDVNKQKKQKDRKGKKAISIDQFVKEVSGKEAASPTSPSAAYDEPKASSPQAGGDNQGQFQSQGQGRGGRGQGRGGSFRGGRGNGPRGGGRGRGRGRGGRGRAGPNVLDESAFPKLGA